MKFTSIALVGAIAAQDGSAPRTTEFSITADDYYELYVDGEFIGADGSWTEPQHFPNVPFKGLDEGVIAIKASETCAGCAYKSQRGIVGVLDGVPTNPADWVCKYYPNEDPPLDWEKYYFDDRLWETPISIPVGKNFGLDSAAQWFWLDNNRSADQKHIYCRQGGSHGLDPELVERLNALKASTEGINRRIAHVEEQKVDAAATLEEKEREAHRLRDVQGDMQRDIDELVRTYESISDELQSLTDIEHPEELRRIEEELQGQIDNLHEMALQQQSAHDDMVERSAAEMEYIQYACGEHEGEADHLVCTEIWQDEPRHVDPQDRPHYVRN